MICEFTPSGSLAAFAVTSRSIYFSARRVLLIRNAKEENSTAIYHAVMEIAPKDWKRARVLITRAIKHGADVNAVHSKGDACATVLAIAAAGGYHGIVSFLISHNAHVEIPSRKLWCFLKDERTYRQQLWKRAEPCLTSTLGHCADNLRRQLLELQWLPLLIPFIRQDIRMVDLLFKSGASGRLTSKFKGDRCGALTALHIIAGKERTDSIRNDTETWEIEVDQGIENWAHYILHSIHRSLLDERLPCEGGSALHIALREGQQAVFKRLITMGADLNLKTALIGRTPLHVAVTRCHRAGDPVSRKVYQLFAESLVQHGANLNQISSSEYGYTPLMTLIDAAQWDWKDCYRNIKALMDLFIKKGARINHMSRAGETVVHLLLNKIVEKNGNQSLIGLLETLISEGADLNIPFSYRKSIAKAIIFDVTETPMNLVNLLVQNGAVLAGHEIDLAFRRWAKSPRLRKRYDMNKQREQVSPSTVDTALWTAFCERNLGLAQELLKDWGQPVQPSRYIERALKDAFRKMMPLLQDIEFDPNWRGENGGFLHVIVVAMYTTRGYTEKVAMENAEILIDKGMSVLTLDNEGLSGIQLLRKFEIKAEKLELFLLRQKDKERGEE